MIATRDYIAEIRIFNTMNDILAGRKKKMSDYFSRHGWTNVGGSAGHETYRRMVFHGCTYYKKVFSDCATMEAELLDIEAAFHDGYAAPEGCRSLVQAKLEPYRTRSSV